MKHTILRIFMAAAVAVAPSAFSQTSQGGGGEAAILRPEMPMLFYTPQQRRVLEAVRQEVISEEIFEEEEFVPLVLQQERLEILDDEEEQQRTKIISLQGLIRNRKTGNTSMWNDKGEAIQFADGSDTLKREGVQSIAVSPDNPNAIEGIDVYNQSRFLLKVGQELAIDGSIGETYPVIIRKN